MRKVFISYSSKDGEKAALVAGAIEGMGCDCWMAPRDIAPGCNYAEAIVDGLDGCTVFLLLLSSDSQASEHVVRELERAVSKGKKIMAVRLEKVSLSKSFEYFLQVTHWIDATDNLDAASLAKVANAAVALTGGARAPEGTPPKPAQASPRKAGDADPPPARDRAPTFEGGQKFGDFEVLSRLGQGGMGTVYKAQQISLERPVALKTLQGALASDPEYIARFRREAKAAAALNHPNLVQVYAAGETDGLHWFAMEYVEGESAQDRLKRKGRLDPAAAIAIGMNVATALDHGWRKAQLIHRDIKPDNIFLSTDGEVKLGDLGLAKSVGENQSLTMAGSAMGTPHYVSPEQAEGKMDVDLRADIYSLGCTLFHLLSGKPPFGGGTALSVMMQHVSAPVPELRSVWPECPAELSRVVMKMMAKQPAERQQSHEEVVADLRNAYRAFSQAAAPEAVAVTHAGKPSAPEEQQPPSDAQGGDAVEPAVERNRPSRKPMAIAAIALLAAIGALVYFSPWKTSTGTGSGTTKSKLDPAKASAYAGLWYAQLNGQTYLLNEDFTAVVQKGRNGSGATGKWELISKGVISVDIVEENPKTRVKTFRLSEDGSVLNSTTTNARWDRVLSSQENASVPATPAPPPPTPTPGSAAYYAGTWRGGVKGTSGFVLEEDFTGIREHPRDDRGDENGTWKVDKDGGFEFYNLEGGRWLGKFSADGHSLVNTKSGDILKRLTAAPKPVKFDPTMPASYVGSWTLGGKRNVSIKEDHTAIRMDPDGTKTNGTWEIVERIFRCKWSGQGSFSGTLSDDGQTIEPQGATGAVWTRQKP